MIMDKKPKLPVPGNIVVDGSSQKRILRSSMIAVDSHNTNRIISKQLQGNKLVAKQPLVLPQSELGKRDKSKIQNGTVSSKLKQVEVQSLSLNRTKEFFAKLGSNTGRDSGKVGKMYIKTEVSSVQQCKSSAINENCTCTVECAMILNKNKKLLNKIKPNDLTKLMALQRNGLLVIPNMGNILLSDGLKTTKLPKQSKNIIKTRKTFVNQIDSSQWVSKLLNDDSGKTGVCLKKKTFTIEEKAFQRAVDDFKKRRPGWRKRKSVGVLLLERAGIRVIKTETVKVTSPTKSQVLSKVFGKTALILNAKKKSTARTDLVKKENSFHENSVSDVEVDILTVDDDEDVKAELCKWSPRKQVKPTEVTPPCKVFARPIVVTSSTMAGGQIVSSLAG